MVQFLRDMNAHEGSKTGTTGPILACVEAMVLEMDQRQWQKHVEFEYGKVLDEVVLGMNVVSLDDDDNGGEDASIQVLERETIEPHCYLGLLGMDVGGGRVRWKGPMEESWRLFWKLYA
ncbi:UNVERIFIED_CONTAM: hypothetical protein HDU68_012007 [Siphonaria sp. JEL0065]|nr:hypothetical protein HDU68_012007 [Siphonaria sp. JEL0065]